MAFLGNNGLQTQIQLIKNYVSKAMPTEYTETEINGLWNIYFGVTVTVTITQSAHQTIHVVANGVDHTETFTITAGTAYTATIVPDAGYNAGTISSASGAVTNDITITATAAAVQTFTLTLDETEDQTITLTYTEPGEEAQTLTSTNTAQEVTVVYGTTWIASITADTGYNAGILSASSGTITADTTVSATAATLQESEPEPEGE